jgi:hypothetical protein
MGALGFRFAVARNTAVMICGAVRDGRPVLFACRDADGDWQFLCGEDHPDGGDDKPLLVCIDHVVASDPSLNDLADMFPLHSATRAGRDAPWVVHDEMEDVVHRNIREHGWHAMKVPQDDEGPGFVYTIGFYRTWGHPELICVGLPLDVAHQALRACAAHVKAGGQLADADEFWGAFDNARCSFRTMVKQHYREYLGYARWYYGGDAFPAIQVLWPDSKGRLPVDDGCAESTVRGQVPLWRE